MPDDATLKRTPDPEKLSAEQLVRELKRVRKENEYLKRQREILKKAMSIAFASRTGEMRSIRELSAVYSTSEICEALVGEPQWLSRGGAKAPPRFLPQREVHLTNISMQQIERVYRENPIAQLRIVPEMTRQFAVLQGETMFGAIGVARCDAPKSGLKPRQRRPFGFRTTDVEPGRS